ncbi:MAG TPA: exodeoxyribonuclease V subunit alpha [Polyangiaceae bacterium]|nr:exodeoxyribonuclease V subunit alpha [Polyangiaceae bacterium]
MTVPAANSAGQSGTQLASSNLLEELAARGVLSALDRHFAVALGRLASEPPEVLLAAAFASRAVQNGHVCVDLTRVVSTELYDAEEEPIRGIPWPEPDRWLALLRQSALVSDGTAARPLVLDGAGRLYLHRYWTYQQELAEQIRLRASGLSETAAPEELARSLARLFPTSDASSTPEALQQIAVLLAAHKRFALISGGPGTGKTYTVVKLLALLQEQTLERGLAPLRIALVAPTGKAAARLSESITENLGRVVEPKLQPLIPSAASTIHRVLGYLPRTPTRFRHNERNALPIDVLLVDEASMVDLALLAKLLTATPSSARVILLGDKDQLASIEAGAVFGDIYAAGAEQGYSAEFSERLRQIAGMHSPGTGTGHAERSGVGDSVVHLTKSHRYGPESGIARLAAAVNAGAAESALALLPESAPAQRTQLTFEFASAAREPRLGDTALIRIADPKQLEARLRLSVLRGYSAYCRERDVRRKLGLLNGFRVLCAHRNGPFGIGAMNTLVERLLNALGQLDPHTPNYDGRPIMVTRNDYQLELFNGDVGAIVREAGGAARAYFLRPNGELRSFLPSRLPPHETVFAMTVHKSQGSEFDEVLLVLPPEPSAIITRELVYTAVTRARRRVEIAATPSALQAAIGTRVQRASGLADALSEGAPRAR